VGDARDAAGARRLLVGDRVHEQVAGEPDAEAREHLCGRHHRRDAALHVARAAPEEQAVAHDGRVRVVRPACLRLARDDVDVAVQEQAAPAAGAREAREQLWPAREVELERHLPAAHVLGPRLPDLDGRAGRAQPRREVGLERRLVACRVARVACRRVEPDQVGGELHELVAALGDRGHDALLEVVHPSHSSTGLNRAPAPAPGMPIRCPADR
jgi:hypothetical protein